ncbi:MAG TPA: HEAT repeat domain-containing protein, partial [bacterium]|nr:HEAT repeat domain-containing protein [bacterium]
MKRHLLWLLICSNLFFLPVYSQQRVEKMEELIKKIKQESGDLYPITVAISQLAANFPQAHALFPDLFRSAKTLRVKRHLLTEMKKYSMAGLDQALAAALEEPDARLRADAAACLENIRKSSLFSSLLEKAIRDQDAEVRLLAAGVLASTAELLVAWPALAWEIMADRNVLVRQSFLSRLVPDERVVRLLGAQLYLCLLSEDTMTAMAAARAAVRLNLFRKDSTAREKQWPVVLKAFLKALGEEDVTKAGKAAWCLDVFWNEEVAEKLKQTVTSGSFWQRARASTLLRKKKVPFDLTGLAEVLRDGSEAMQLYVCGELARLQTQECVPLVAWAMDSCFSSVRQAAVYALEVMNSVAATETLMKGLSSSDRNVRLRVARVLGRRPNSEAAFSLLKKVSESDADPEVRQAALTASLIISGADLSGVLVGRESLLQQVAELPAKKVMKTAGRMTEVKNGVVVVGSQKQLLVDDLVIEDIGSARRVLHKFKKDPRNPVLEQEFPWELQGTCCFLTTVHYDPESRLFSFWYTSFGRLAREGEAVRSRAQCLAYSTDGLHWVRPNIGLYEFQGSKKNNLVGSAANIVLIPGEKNQVEKFASYIYSPSLNAMAVSFSPDGISNWTQF